MSGESDGEWNFWLGRFRPAEISEGWDDEIPWRAGMNSSMACQSSGGGVAGETRDSG